MTITSKKEAIETLAQRKVLLSGLPEFFRNTHKFHVASVQPEMIHTYDNILKMHQDKITELKTLIANWK